LGKAFFQKLFKAIEEASISKIVWIAICFFVDEEDNQNLMKPVTKFELEVVHKRMQKD